MMENSHHNPPKKTKQKNIYFVLQVKFENFFAVFGGVIPKKKKRSYRCYSHHHVISLFPPYPQTKIKLNAFQKLSKKKKTHNPSMKDQFSSHVFGAGSTCS